MESRVTSLMRALNPKSKAGFAEGHKTSHLFVHPRPQFFQYQLAWSKSTNLRWPDSSNNKNLGEGTMSMPPLFYRVRDLQYSPPETNSAAFGRLGQT